jgi:hypothetical protein
MKKACFKPSMKVSGYSKGREATAMLAKECDGFIQKQFKINELSRSIRQEMECRTIA